MIRAGKLTEFITIERETETVAPSGHVHKSWAPVATIRAELKQATTEEFFAAHGEADATAAVFLIRWHPGLDLTPADRTHRRRAYNIKTIAEVGRRRGLKLRGVAV